ncbi:hypothetical protein BH10ACT6_BH10ACT6_05200 [soil metagenome]
MTHPDAALAARRLAGYRVLRLLARDDTAEVLLGFAEREPESGISTARVEGADDEPTIVAVKTMRATTESWAGMFGVLEALERSRGPHVVDVLDVDADGSELCVVFERLANGSLAELLVLRERLEAGEVVTIVAPLAQTLQRMHAAGVAHGALGSRTVMFRADGAPVLIGFGSSTLFEAGVPEVTLEREAGVVADRRAMRELGCLLLSRVTGPRARAARALVEELEACPEQLVLEMIARRLFEVAAALPVRFTVELDAGPQDGVDGVLAGPDRVVPLGVPIPTEEPTSARLGVLARLVPDAWVQRLVDAVEGSPLARFRAAVLAPVVSPVLATAARTWRGWSPGRRRLVLGAGAALLTVGGVLVLVPSAPASREDAVLAPTAAASSSSSAASDEDAALGGDDPLPAAIVLVTARERCLRSLSLLCLDAVDQADAAALRDDRDLIRASRGGGELPGALVPEGATLAPELVERLGDSALVRLAVLARTPPPVQRDTTTGSLREPASLLLVKSETGWRIRDVITAPTDSSTGTASG